METVEQITPRQAWLLVFCGAGILALILGIFALVNEWLLRKELKDIKK